jgi:hypothetical protein
VLKFLPELIHQIGTSPTKRSSGPVPDPEEEESDLQRRIRLFFHSVALTKRFQAAMKVSCHPPPKLETNSNVSHPQKPIHYNVTIFSCSLTFYKLQFYDLQVAVLQFTSCILQLTIYSFTINYLQILNFKFYKLCSLNHRANASSCSYKYGP